MAKRKGSSSSNSKANNFKNPLAQALGIALYKMRGTLSMTSDEVAAKIGLGGSSYRMIEAGSAILHPGRALNIIKVFDRIEFEPLCRLLVAMQVMETGTQSIADLQNASALLGETDPQLKSIFEAIEPIWEVSEREDANTVGKLIEQESIDSIVTEFLTTNKYFGIEQEKRLDFQLNELIEETPSIYLDFVLDNLRSLKKYRMRYFPDESSSWESENKHNFTNLYAIIKNSESINNQENFNNFDYNYLWQPQFQQLNYIFLDQGAKPQKLLQSFKKNLKIALEKKKIKYKQELTSFDEALDKVAFRNGEVRKEELETLLVDKNTHEGGQILWIFTLKNGNHVGFLSNKDINTIFYGTALNYKETRDKLHTFKEIWNELNDE